MEKQLNVCSFDVFLESGDRRPAECLLAIVFHLSLSGTADVCRLSSQLCRSCAQSWGLSSFLIVLPVSCPVLELGEYPTHRAKLFRIFVFGTVISPLVFDKC